MGAALAEIPAAERGYDGEGGVKRLGAELGEIPARGAGMTVVRSAGMTVVRSAGMTVVRSAGMTGRGAARGLVPRSARYPRRSAGMTVVGARV